MRATAATSTEFAHREPTTPNERSLVNFDRVCSTETNDIMRFSHGKFRAKLRDYLSLAPQYFSWNISRKVDGSLLLALEIFSWKVFGKVAPFLLLAVEIFSWNISLKVGRLTLISGPNFLMENFEQNRPTYPHYDPSVSDGEFWAKRYINILLAPLTFCRQKSREVDRLPPISTGSR